MRCPVFNFAIHATGHRKGKMIAIMPSNLTRRNLLKTAAATVCFSAMPRLRALQSNLATDERTLWFSRAKFGMFIHWGPYSLASVEASWPVLVPAPGGISEAEYVALTKTLQSCEVRSGLLGEPRQVCGAALYGLYHEAS